MFDLSTLPVSGGVVIGGALYALVSAGAGQFVAERTIAMSGWTEDCARDIAQFFNDELITRAEDEALIPEVSCDTVIGKWHPAASQFCRELKELGVPDFSELGGVDTKLARKAEERARDLV